MSPTDDERFWSHVRKTERCWVWEKIGGKSFRAHRLSYEMHRGEIPEGLLVRHKCDNRACVRPMHLLLGTVKDNSDDMVRRGRAPVGTRSGRAKITEAIAARIKQLLRGGLGVLEVSLAVEVDRSTVANVSCGRRWKHVQ